MPKEGDNLTVLWVEDGVICLSDDEGNTYKITLQ